MPVCLAQLLVDWYRHSYIQIYTSVHHTHKQLLAGENGLRVVISGQTGCITQWEIGGRALLASPISPCFFRACIDNDRGGTGGRSYASR